jgi:hypothetical protein
MNTETEIKRLTEGLKMDTTAMLDMRDRALPRVAAPASTFQEIRARTRGAIIAAHRDLELDWTEADDKMLDMVTVWLDNRKGR